MNDIDKTEPENEQFHGQIYNDKSDEVRENDPQNKCDETEKGESIHAPNDVVFSSVDTHFSFVICFEQLLFHILFPLLVPFAWYKYGMKHAEIQQYDLSGGLAAYGGTYMACLCVVSALVCLAAEPNVLKAEQLIFPFGTFFLHRLTVAVKYASLSPDEYREFLNIGGTRFYTKLSPEDREKSRRILSNMQLISGWITISDALIKHELIVSSILQGVDLHSLFFYIPLGSNSDTREPLPDKMREDWLRLRTELEAMHKTTKEKKESISISEENMLFRKCNEWKCAKNGKYMKVNCMDVCEYMFYVANRRIRALLNYGVSLVLLFAAVLLYEFWASFSTILERSVYTKVFFISNLYLLGLFCPLLFMFCLVALADVFRRYQFSQMLTDMISVNSIKMVDTKMYQNLNRKRRNAAVQVHPCVAHTMSHAMSHLRSFDKFVIPRIDMSISANYATWCLCRRVISRFGLRYLHRTHIYFGVLSSLAVIQVLHSLHNIFLTSLTSAEICNSFTFSTALISTGTIVAVVCCVMVGIYVTNRRMNEQRILISFHLLQADRALREIRNKEYAVESERQCGADTLLQEEKYDTTVNKIENEPYISQIEECIESANNVVQSMVEFDEIQPLSFMNSHVEKEYIVTIISSVFLYGAVVYSFCNGGFSP